MHSRFLITVALCVCSISLMACASSSKTPENAASANSVTVPDKAAEKVEAAADSQTSEQASTENENTSEGRENAEAGVNAGIEGDVTTAAAASESESIGEQHPTVIVEPEPELTPIQKCLAEGDFAGARKLAMDDLIYGNGSDSSEYWSIVEQDPMLSHTLDEEVQPHGTNSISALGGGSTVSFKYNDSADESVKAALKPDQDLRQTMYRSGIAYYRLCQILGCSFDTPVTRPARFTKANFNALYNASDSSKNKGYRSKFEHLIWAKEDNATYLYVGYKEWISPFTGFPIEVTGVWSPYLKNPEAKLPDVRTFLRNLLAGSRPGADRELGKLTEYMGNLTTRDLLQQISDIILLDYLTNNWDRFAGTQDNYGANCHFQPGGIIAIDNDAAFPSWHAPRVVRRLNLVEMFSRDLVTKLRTLDPDELLKHLFPNPNREELKSFERFKERRRDALKYIDDLIAKKGIDRVLVF